MRRKYFTDLWNIVDTIRITLSALYLITATEYVDFSDDDSEGWRFIRTLALMSTWFRIIAFFRVFSSTRYLIRLIIEIAKGMIPFMCIFLFTVMILCIGLLSLRDLEFIDAW